ncbi:MAG TPA: GMC family oxidoreductase [Gammaproteobacteria bacterium]|nr:GMC family oxidoreductase [Gammaproteobacteria bacterium]
MQGPQYDAVIVGSGAGGGASAWALTRYGMRVLVLEAGPDYDFTKDYLLSQNGWEQTLFPTRPRSQVRYSFAPLQKLDPRWQHLRSWNHITGAMNPGETRKGNAYHHVRGVGGSTLHFTGEAHRLHPQAMKMHSQFGVGADWPLDYQELEPFYCEAERIVGVAGPAENTVRTRSEAYPLPPHRLSYTSSKIVEGGRKLGMHWEMNPIATLSASYDGRPACNYCANCSRGCPRSDKGSVDVTFIRKARASGLCTIQSLCQVLHIEAGDNDRVTSVHYVDRTGAQHKVSAQVVIVSCGAVETPRLLLTSSNRHAPHGLANESGLVGRNFMETLAWDSAGLHPEPLGSMRGLPSDIICWDFNAPDAVAGIVGGSRYAPSTASADLIGPISYATRVVKGWGRQHKTDMRASYGRALVMGAVAECLPNEKSFIDLDPDEKDEFGMPIARIHSHLDEMALRRVEFMAKTCREMLGAAGVEQLFEEYGSYDFFSSTHVFGTCRMGNDPQHSVVDSHCRSHRWRNLFIVDASVFPSTGGGEAPSLTIEALAIRTAAHIRGLAARLEI